MAELWTRLWSGSGKFRFEPGSRTLDSRKVASRGKKARSAGVGLKKVLKERLDREKEALKRGEKIEEKISLNLLENK